MKKKHLISRSISVTTLNLTGLMVAFLLEFGVVKGGVIIAEIKKTRNADLQLGQRKKNIYLKMAKHRLRLKKQFQNRGSKEERLKVMGKYIGDIASNIVVSALGENAGRSDYKDKGPDNNDSMSSVESNVE